jgi:short-subunit dehydrogenase
MNIIVTGAGSGIGYDLVKNFHTGDHKIIAISRNAENLEKLRQDCLKIKSQGNIFPYPLDITGLQNNNEFIKTVTAFFSHVDILINNAGRLVYKSFESISRREFQEVFDVNFFAAAGLIKHLIPLMGNINRGHIVNIGSMGGFQGTTKFPGMSVYSASKAALACLTECLATEFNDRNIAVNCLALGSVQTKMFSLAFPEYRAAMTTPKAADFISEFALNGSKYFNGKILPVSVSTP